MGLFSRIFVAAFILFFFLIGILLVTVALHLVNMENILFTMREINDNTNLRIVIGIVGCMLLLVGIYTIQLIIDKLRREKTIAFDNPDGQVTISLQAIEDFIRKITREISDIKEVKSSVRASKKGVDITNRVTLLSDSNIPDVAERIQGMIRTRVQEMLGIEEPIQVKVHIVKIAQREKAKKISEEKQAAEAFRGIDYTSE